MKRIIFIFVATILTFWGCDTVNDSSVAPEVEGDWLIPRDEVYEGGPGRDGIPALDSPNMASASSISYLRNSDLVLGIKFGDDIRAYPHAILDWHEIINDGIDEHKFAVTYCPLTGSGIAWNRQLEGKETTFGVSGLLYNTNLIPYDRATNSNWSQMRLQSVSGKMKGEFIETYQLVETTWETWKKMYPASRVVTTSTGFNKPYGNFPYGDFRTNHDYLLFPVNNEDSRLERKVRVHGIISDGTAKAYSINSFAEGIEIVMDQVGGKPVVIAGSREQNLTVSFESQLKDGAVLSFTPLQDELPLIIMDNSGSKWDIFGRAVSGPNKGKQLKPTRSFNAYWFAWAAFYPNTALHSN